jgi:signal transduction histidine kinase/CheY-like chemotaxis protein
MVNNRLACFEAGERIDGKRMFFTEEVPQPCKDGSTVWTEVVTSYWRNPKTDRIEVHGVSRDITGRRAAEAEKRNLQEQLEQSRKLESIGRLAGGIAHDFNNMLTVILSEVEIALMPSSNEPPERAFEAIGQAATRAAELTRQLLAFARKQSAVPRVLALNQLITGALTMLRRLIGENIRLDWRPGADVRPVRVDPAQIDQILVNLCVNARDAIEGVGTLTIETMMATLDASHHDELPDSYSGEFVVLVVSDTGHGMTEETREHIFEPFFTTKARGKGTGLGLATVYGIARQNGGFVSVQSQLGRGSSFRVYFPVSSGVVTTDERAKKPVEVSGTGTVVLLVEDEPSVLQVSRTLLEHLGFTVLSAGSPGEALKLAGNFGSDIHILVTDVVMPEMSGKELYSRLRQIRPWLKCLYVSGYAAGLGYSAGILDDGVVLLEKPYTLRSLANKLNEAMLSNQ